MATMTLESAATRSKPARKGWTEGDTAICRYCPLLLSLANTGEPFFLKNRSVISAVARGRDDVFQSSRSTSDDEHRFTDILLSRCDTDFFSDDRQ